VSLSPRPHPRRWTAPARAGTRVGWDDGFRDGPVNPSTALATVIVDGLVRLGVRHAVLCPGSRSAPLAYALAAAAEEGRIRLHVRIDERTAGFLALGLARGAADAAPAAVVTTSGTAVANLHPAVLEAAHSCVPMLVLSADRPHDLRGTGASQTTDQVKLFGSAVRWFGEIPAPTAVLSGQGAAWRNVVARAVAAARGGLGGGGGPVQLNLGFADPLTPDADPGAQELTGLGDLSGSGDPSGLTRVMAGGALTPALLEGQARTVVLAGDGAGRSAADLAARAGWPLLAEPSSGVRAFTTAVPYRMLLDGEPGTRIERVVVFGRPTLSRPVTRLLSDRRAEVVVVSSRPDWTDPGRTASLVAPAVDVPPGFRADPDWNQQWARAGQNALKVIDEVLDAQNRLVGPSVARAVADATGPGDLLVSGSSNPIRDLDLVARIDPGAQVLANRGLAGIDGTISTAVGAGLAAGRRTRLLLGDLTFLHDAGGLLVAPGEPRPDLQIVVVDDNGGGIFATLEHGARAGAGERQNRHFERVFATPQAVDLALLCRAHGVPCTRIEDTGQLAAALAEPPVGISLLHVPIDRTRHRELAARLQQAVGRL